MILNLRRRSFFLFLSLGNVNRAFADTINTKEVPNGIGSAFQRKGEASPMSLESITNINYLLADKIVPVLVDLFLHAPATEKYKIFPEIIQGLGR